MRDGATAVVGAAGRAGRVVVDADRLWRRLGELAEIGRDRGGGVTRLSFADEELAARDLVASCMEEAGLEVREDAAGNLIGRPAKAATPMPPSCSPARTWTPSGAAATSTAHWACSRR